MGLNDTPAANRIHIGFFGRRNAGKSSVVNAVTGQDIALVSDTKGTTTDPVYKAMELLPLGPVMIIDTPGFDDEGALGEKRVLKTKQVLNKTDAAVLVVDSTEGMKECDRELISLFKEKEIPYIVAYNKSDIAERTANGENEICISALTGSSIHELKEKLSVITATDDTRFNIVGDLIHPSDLIVLVVPIDSAAPKGRLILPQQQTIRDILEANAAAVVVQETELKSTLETLGKKPFMVICDSQVFEKTAKDTPHDIYLTSFSILMARFKGFLDTAVKGVRTLDSIKDGDTILISEGCTHHRQCDDIGTVKLPRWIKGYTGKDVNFEFTSGGGFPDDLSKYSLVIHCGGCMITEREVKYRMKCALDQNIPFTNYGTTIAHIHGILDRSLEIFPHLKKQ